MSIAGVVLKAALVSFPAIMLASCGEDEKCSVPSEAFLYTWEKSETACSYDPHDIIPLKDGPPMVVPKGCSGTADAVGQKCATRIDYSCEVYGEWYRVHGLIECTDDGKTCTGEPTIYSTDEAGKTIASCEYSMTAHVSVSPIK